MGDGQIADPFATQCKICRFYLVDIDYGKSTSPRQLSICEGRGVALDTPIATWVHFLLKFQYAKSKNNNQ